jgi:hypothetical protein
MAACSGGMGNPTNTNTVTRLIVPRSAAVWSSATNMPAANAHAAAIAVSHGLCPNVDPANTATPTTTLAASIRFARTA